MADLDLSKLTDAQLGALKMAGGDLTKLPDAALLDIKSTLEGKPKSLGRRVLDTADAALDTVNRTIINPVGTGLTKGANMVMGAGTDMGKMNESIAQWGGEKLGIPETGAAVGKVLRHAVPGFGLMPSSEELNKVTFDNLAPEVNYGDMPALTFKPPILDGGEINVGKMIDAGIQAIPSMVAGGAPSMLSGRAQAARMAIPALAGGGTSEAAGQATAGTPYEIPARVLGGVAGYAGGSRAVTPLPANLSQEQARAVQLAKDMKVPLTVPEETGRLGWLQRGLERFPLTSGPFERVATKQGAATDRAALKTMGYEGDSVGPLAMKPVANQASGEFEAAKNAIGTVPLDRGFFDRIKAVLTDYKGNQSDVGIVPSVEKNVAALTKLEPGKPALTPLAATTAERTPTLARLTQAIEDASAPQGAAMSRPTGAESISTWLNARPNVPMPKAPPELSGDQYRAFRKTINDTVTELYGAGKTDAAKALEKVRTALDDAAEMSQPAEVMEAMKTARRHYANFKIIEGAAARGTQGTRSEGTLSASGLTTELRQAQGDRFSHTTGGLNDVATVKQYLADTHPNSGTPTTLATQGLITGASALAGGGPAMLAGGLGPAGIASAAAAIGLPPLVARALAGGGPVSNLIRSYLANQTMEGAPRLSDIKQLPFALAPRVAVSAPGYPRLERRQ